ncbi:TrmH family RNA methyltransferase [Alkalihalobacillus trypoxylicola]|uniref:RNA methyltransferase n=1 Tax=Alkalihalobacillus trypoxylicola TaxID=519424 RepID=A0A161Q719_9BACI|nr:RNA methyltransferase [Alkalihalobacillus trypoxylicola]KYG32228.1 RNA methyltransferase [Alkalihalobacillus trypoxylicola]
MKRIESVKNEQIKNWKKLQSKKGRDKAGKFIVEGFHLVEEAMKANLVMEAILITDDMEIPQKWTDSRQPLIMVTKQVLKELTETPTPQGVIAILKKPSLPDKMATTGQWLLIDRVQDPGNVGTMIRTAEACGMTGVVLGDGCADLYNSKVIRGTQGALFHLPIIQGTLLKMIQEVKAANMPVFGTAIHGALEYTSIQVPKSFALIVGNEGEGVAKELLNECQENVYIPILGQSQSLNVAVASGILMYYFKSS